MHKITNSICSGCGHLADDTTTAVCCEINNYITIQEFIAAWKENKETTQWPEEFTQNEFESFVRENEYMLDDDFIENMAEDRYLCQCDCEDCGEHEYSAYPDSESISFNERRALDYFVENMEYFTLERLEGLKAIIKI